MEALEKLAARNALRLDPSVLDPVVVHTYEDIRRVVNELDPKLNPAQVDVPISTLMNVTEDNKPITYRVEAKTRSRSKRDQLVEGLRIVRDRMAMDETIAASREPVEVNGREMKPATVGYRSEGSTWVDPLLKQWLGAKRQGWTVIWELSDGYTYKYDIFQHKLSRIPTKDAPRG